MGDRSRVDGPVLEDAHPRLGYNGGVVSEESDLWVLLRRDPWIASLMTDSGEIHAVIVDGERGGTVWLRDPWGKDGFGSDCGVWATIALIDFVHRWTMARFHAVFPSRRK